MINKNILQRGGHVGTCKFVTIEMINDINYILTRILFSVIIVLGVAGKRALS